MPRDLARELDELPDEPTITWEPEVGDTIIGRIRVKDTVPSKFQGTPRPRLLLETESGELVTVYCSHTVLEREITEQQASVGDRIAIRRLSDVPGKAYRRYKVLVEHLTATDTDEWTPEGEPAGLRRE